MQKYYEHLGYFFCEISFRISREIPSAESGILNFIADKLYHIGTHYYNKGA